MKIALDTTRENDTRGKMKKLPEFEKLRRSLLLTACLVVAAFATQVRTAQGLPNIFWTNSNSLEKVFGPTLPAGSQSTPVIPVPKEYGRYCSIVYSSGGWAFSLLKGQKSDPCAELLKSSPGGTIMRAGLWSENGNNNVMLRCEGGGVGLWREIGDKAAGSASAAAQGKRFCVFVMSPTKLPVFVAPYGKIVSFQPSVHTDVRVTNVHNFNLYEIPINVREFGQAPVAGHTDAHVFDRKGRQMCRIGSRSECCPDPENKDTCQPAGCHIRPSHGGYDWLMPKGKPIKSVAAGKVIKYRTRDVTEFDCPRTVPDQQEVYILHTVGSGGYEEQFITYYAHMSKTDVNTGDTVSEGQTIGEAGTTGCSTGNHLHFGTARLTNTTGFLRYPYELTTGGCGDNSFPVVIDPFGWAAPRNIDPFAWMPLGNRETYCTGGKVVNPGAFSIALWKNGAAPPNK